MPRILGIVEVEGLAEDVPAQLGQILVDLEGGKFRVNVHSEDVDRVGGHVRAIGVMIFLGLLAAGLAGGGIVALAVGDLPAGAWRVEVLGAGYLLAGEGEA